jgi:predicted solute-binding protein
MMSLSVKIAAPATLSAVPLVYGLRSAKEITAEVALLSQNEIADALREGRVDVALLAADVARTIEGVKIVTDFCVAPVDKGGSVSLADEWGVAPDAPVYGIIVAREGVDAEVLDAIERGLTTGVERIYEALLSQAECPRVEDYSYLTTTVDYLFDAKKHTALEAFWKKLKKAASHANPG